MANFNIIENLFTTSTLVGTFLTILGVVLAACVTLLSFLGVFLSVEQDKDKERLKNTLLKLTISSGDGLSRKDVEEVRSNARLLRIQFWDYFNDYSDLIRTFKTGVRNTAINIGKCSIKLTKLLIVIGWALLERDIATNKSIDVLESIPYHIIAVLIFAVLWILLNQINGLLDKINNESALKKFPSAPDLLNLGQEESDIDTIDFMANCILCYIRYESRYTSPSGNKLDGLSVRIALPLPFHNAEIETEVNIENPTKKYKSGRIELRNNQEFFNVKIPKNMPTERYSFFFENLDIIKRESRIKIVVNVYPQNLPDSRKFHLICYPYDLSEENAFENLERGLYLDLYLMTWLSDRELSSWQQNDDDVVVVSGENQE